MKIKISLGEKIFKVVNILILACITLVTLYPIWHVFMGSFSDAQALSKHVGMVLKPVGFSLDAYRTVFTKKEIWVGYGNTLFYLISGTFINMIVTVPLAYFLSKNNLRLQKYLMLAIVFTMYFSGGMIPTYLIVQALHLTDTRWAVLLPTAVSTFNLIVMRTAFVNVPPAMEEAAKIDGAGACTILVKVILPLVKPTLAVIVLYYAVGHWNQWFQAMLYLRKQSLYPLQLYLREILIENQNSDLTMDISRGNSESVFEVIKYATIVVSTVPILILYPFLQKYFVQGVMIGAVKG